MHLLTSLSREALLEELEWHTSSTMMGKWVVLLALLRVVRVFAVVVPRTKLCDCQPARKGSAYGLPVFDSTS